MLDTVGEEPMRLSEAIRLGAMLSPQTRGAFFKRRGEDVASCALGAAAQAVGTKPGEWLWPSDQWPILNMMVPPAELPDELRSWAHPRYLALVIITLNDTIGWTRTRIADWVEQFEERHAGEFLEGAPSERQAGALSDLTKGSDEDPEELVGALCVR
jgi:hypothetical protein